MHALLCLAALAASQPPPTGLPSLQGVLTNAVTGAPVRNANVTLKPLLPPPEGDPAAAVRHATSDETGKFAFTQLTPGDYLLSAERPGFLRARFRSKDSQTVHLPPGASVIEVAIQMTPLGRISGRVTDDAGDPVSAAQVTAYGFRLIQGRRSWVPTGPPTNLDDEGVFRISNLAPGRYYVAASMPFLAPRPPDPPPADYVTTFFPSATGPDAAVPLIVAAGNEARADIRLRRERVFRVTGTVVDSATGQAPEHPFVVRLQSPRSRPGLPELFDWVMQGRFQFTGVLPGLYTITPSSTEYLMSGRSLTARSYGEFPVSVSTKDVLDLTVRFQSGFTLTGHVPGLERGVAVLRPVRPGMRTYSSPIRPAGEFAFQDVAPGVYHFTISNLPDNIYIRHVAVADRKLNPEYLDLTGGSPGKLAVELGSDAATLAGATDRPGEYLVTLLPSAAKAASGVLPLRHARTSPNGKFEIKALPPGEYLLLAWDAADPHAAMDAEFHALFASRATLVTVPSALAPNKLTPISEDGIAQALARIVP